MSTGPSHYDPPEALESIQAAVAEFRDQCATWQRDVDGLFDDLSAAIGALNATTNAATDEAEVLGELQAMGRTLREENQDLHQQQEQLVDEMGVLRGLVEQQLDLVGSLVRGEDSLEKC